jgi:hypothetical protein
MYFVLITLHVWEIKVTSKSGDIRELKKKEMRVTEILHIE